MMTKMIPHTSHFSSFAEVLQSRAAAQPAQRAYTFLSEGEHEADDLTFAELDRRARALGVFLQSIKAQGERVLLLYPSGLSYITAFYGCLYAGAVAVPAYPPRMNRHLDRLMAVINDAQPMVVLTTSSVYQHIQKSFNEIAGLKSIRWINTDDFDFSLASQWQGNAASHETLAFLQYTSGSTSAPKGVMVSHGNLLYNEAMIQESLQYNDETVFVSWLPFYHDLGLIGTILSSVYNGVSCYFMSPADFLKKPLRWLQAISKYRATCSGGPNFAYDLCIQKIAEDQRAGLDLSSWKHAFNGAEPIRAQTLNRFSQTYAPYGFNAQAHYPCYGMAEATLLVTGGTCTAPPLMKSFDKSSLEQHRIVPVADAAHAETLVSCGIPWLEERVVIANPQTLAQCPPDQVGEIWVAGKNVAQGYWGNAIATQETFHAYLSDTGEGPFLRTGDLGFVQDGELYITGRLKDLIILLGRNHYPQDIELTVETSHPALRPGCAAAFAIERDGTERLVVVVEVAREQRNKVNVAQVVSEIRRRISAAHELEVFAVALISPGTLPKTSSGKVQRRATRAAFLTGQLDTLYQWEVGNSFEHKQPVAFKGMTEKLKTIEGWLAMEFATKMKIGIMELDLTRPVAAYGLDSLSATEIIARIEDALKITMSVDMLFLGEPNIAQIARKLLDQLQGAQQQAVTFPVEHENLLPDGIGVYLQPQPQM